MNTARIIEDSRRTTQSGKAKQAWTLEFVRQEAIRPDPMMGWAGSGDTDTQVRLRFETLAEAEAYANRQGLTTTIVRAAPVGLKLQSYADNFR